MVHNFCDRGAVAHLRRRGPLLLLLRVLRHRQEQEEEEGPGRDSSLMPFDKFPPVANIVFKNQFATKLLILFNILEREITRLFRSCTRPPCSRRTPSPCSPPTASRRRRREGTITRGSSSSSKKSLGLQGTARRPRIGCTIRMKKSTDCFSFLPSRRPRPESDLPSFESSTLIELHN